MDQRILSVISKQIAELFHLSSIPKLAADDPRKRGKRIEKKKVNYTSYIDLLISCRHLLLQQSCVVGKPRAGAYSYDQKNDNRKIKIVRIFRQIKAFVEAFEKTNNFCAGGRSCCRKRMVEKK